jgi:hypothetical protein
MAIVCHPLQLRGDRRADPRRSPAADHEGAVGAGAYRTRAPCRHDGGRNADANFHGSATVERHAPVGDGSGGTAGAQRRPEAGVAYTAPASGNSQLATPFDAPDTIDQHAHRFLTW